MNVPQEFYITIQVAKGGFIMRYPSKEEEGGTRYELSEVFTSSRKMNQRLKEVLEYTSTTPVDAE